MKNAFLVMVGSALLVTLGFAQTPDAGSNTNMANVSGCLGGSDGAYTVTEDGTRQVFKITTSSVDLKSHVGHDVKLTGQNASAAASSGAADHNFAVTELSMISEHCAAAAAATAGAAPYAGTVVEPAAPPAAPSATASAPAPDAAAPAATASTPDVEAVPAVATPAAESAAPAAVVSPSAPTVSTPPVEAAAPAATVSPSSAPVKTPVARANHPAPAAHARKGSAAEAAASAVTARTEPVSKTLTTEPSASADADAATAVAAVNPPPAGVPAPDASTSDAAAPAPPVTHRAGSLSLLVGFVVLVIVLGTTAPLIARWRKRKMLERDGSPNLSFTNDSSGNELKASEVRPIQGPKEPKEPRRVA